MPTNVLGTELKCCCRDPLTGFYRDGYCRTGPDDIGQHTVCVQVTQEFLDFSVLDGNDLVTPRPEWGFPGLKPGDKWCVCVTRWKAALDHNRAAPIDLEATHSSALEFMTMEELKAHPEVRQLMVRNPWTAALALSIVTTQTAIAYGMGRLGFHYWWLSLLVAYFVGAFANHANYVIIHDATHNLIFRHKSWNIFT